MMAQNIKRFLILLFATLLTACGAVTPYVPKPTITATVRKTPQLATATPTLTPTPTVTISPIDAYIQNVATTLGECAQVYIAHSARSPDGNWTAYPCDDELLVINQDGLKGWHLRYSQFSNIKQSFVSDKTLVAEHLDLFHWSGDGQYLYFYPLFPATGPCCWDPIYGYIDVVFDEMWQLNLTTGAYFNVFEKIGSIKDDDYPRLSTVYFSPDDKTMLVIPQLWTPPHVYVYDLQTNTMIHDFRLLASNESTAAGKVVWSADGQIFVLASTSGRDMIAPDKKSQYSIIVIDLKTMTQKVIVSNKKGVYINLLPITDKNILPLEFHNDDDSYSFNDYKEYDLSTNQFVTPVP